MNAHPNYFRALDQDGLRAAWDIEHPCKPKYPELVPTHEERMRAVEERKVVIFGMIQDGVNSVPMFEERGFMRGTTENAIAHLIADGKVRKTSRGIYEPVEVNDD